MSGELYELACSVPWSCTAEALEAILSIAAREPLPEDELLRRLHGPTALAMRRGDRRTDSGRMTMHGSVAVIPIDGPIYRYADVFTQVSGGVTTESLARDLQTALDDSAVSGIVFPIDSPGGESTGIGELADAIYQARQRKPVAAYIEGYGASAAYWLASAAHVVIADPSAMVGSIGTILGVPDPSKRPRVRIDIVSRQSPKKRPDVTTEAGRQVLQQYADDLTEVFLSAVARNRNLTLDQLLSLEGGMVIGQQAVDAGLADALGSEAQTIAAMQRGAYAAYLDAPPTRPVLAPAQPAPKEAPMSERKGFWAWMGGGSDEPPTTPPPALAIEQPLAPPTSGPPAPVPDDAARSENAELRRQIAAMQAAQIARDAESFVQQQLAAGHAVPTEQQAMLALYVRAAELDATAPHSDGAPSTVALLTAAYAARPANRLAANLIANTGALSVLPATSGGGDPYADDEKSARAYAERANGTHKR